ncbi:hypothetical protein C8J56DRAFT_1166716 [Mycena floridula]|nr:hypothetical protein C8J56DRAFT_1166716 [Mycena floridula]
MAVEKSRQSLLVLFFAGREAGSGTRAQVYGNSIYGSGYPGPLAWGGVAWAGGVAYLHDSEYSRYDNASRPGGMMTHAIFPSNTGTTTFHLVADTTAVSDLIHDITSACS